MHHKRRCDYVIRHGWWRWVAFFLLLCTSSLLSQPISMSGVGGGGVVCYQIIWNEGCESSPGLLGDLLTQFLDKIVSVASLKPFMWIYCLRQ